MSDTLSEPRGVLVGVGDTSPSSPPLETAPHAAAATARIETIESLSLFIFPSLLVIGTQHPPLNAGVQVGQQTSPASRGSRIHSGSANWMWRIVPTMRSTVFPSLSSGSNPASV